MREESRKGDWIQTYTGRIFWPIDPLPEEVFIEDIAHALSNQCRFAGHTETFYSVAQHSVLVSKNLNDGFALRGLLHDAPEAYLVDLIRPVKHFSTLGEAYKELEEALDRVICSRFGLPLPMPDAVKYMDNRLLETEKRDLLKPMPKKWHEYAPPLKEKIIPQSPKEAEFAFLARFRELVPTTQG